VDFRFLDLTGPSANGQTYLVEGLLDTQQGDIVNFQVGEGEQWA
jgi:hypothetical protein